MIEKEYMLTSHIKNWLLYATTTLNMEENEAILMWNKKNNVGKKLICVCKNGYTDEVRTRLFVYHEEASNYVWNHTFTFSLEKVNKNGLWIAEVVDYYLDSRRNLNCEVRVLKPVDDICISFSNNSAWWLMMTESEAFLPEYKPFPNNYNGHHQPNLEALKERFPEFKDLSTKEIGEKALDMYLTNEIEIKDIEECLDMPNDWEKLILEISSAIYHGDIKALYGEMHPLFANKVSHNVMTGNWYVDTEDYIRRQLEYYDELVKDGKIEHVDGDKVLDAVEAALAYRKALKDAEKAERKEKRKKKRECSA